MRSPGDCAAAESSAAWLPEGRAVTDHRYVSGVTAMLPQYAGTVALAVSRKSAPTCGVGFPLPSVNAGAEASGSVAATEIAGEPNWMAAGAQSAARTLRNAGAERLPSESRTCTET